MADALASGVDTDADALAATLHRLADAIEDDEVLVNALRGSTGFDNADDVIIGWVEIEFTADESRRELFDVVNASVLSAGDTTVSLANDEL